MLYSSLSKNREGSNMKGTRPLTQPEIEAVLKSFKGTYRSRDRALFLLGLTSGLRISELLSVRIGDILEYGAVVERLSVRRRSTKGRREGRTVLLHPRAKEAMAAWLRVLEGAGRLDEGDFLFQSRKGQNRPVSRVHAWRVLRRAYAENELPGKLGTHSMRKTFAARIYDALGGDLVKTQRALGHQCVNSTAQYLSFKEEEIDQAILAM